MIKNIKIENYRGLNLELKDCTLINLIIGKANSGKTTVLEQPYNMGDFLSSFVYRYCYGFKQYVTIETDQLILEDDKDYSKMIDSIIDEPVDVIIANACYDLINKKELSIFEEIRQELAPIKNTYVREDGMGLRKVYKIITELLTVSKNGFVSIDDIEIGWHISVFELYLKWILKLAKQKNIQLFITTHSLEIIDTILELNNNSNDITLFNLDDEERFSEGLLRRLRFDRGLDVR